MRDVLRLAVLVVAIVPLAAGGAAADPGSPEAGGGAARTDPGDDVSGLLAEGRTEEAEAAAERQLAAAGGRDGAPTAALAEALDALALVRLKTGRADDQCRALLDRALGIRAATGGRESAGYAQATWRLGDWHLANRDYAAARASYETALEIQVRAAGEDSAGASEVRKRLAQAYAELGLDRESLDLVAREIAAVERERGPDHPDLCPLLYQYALALDRVGEPRAAEAAFLRALAIAEEALGPDHLLVAYLSNGLGILYSQSLYEYTRARAPLERAIAIAEAVGHPAAASFRNNLGVVLKDLGDWDEAQRVYEQALAELIAQQGEDDPYVASTMANVAQVAMLAGDLERARELETRAMEMRIRHLGEDHPEVATSLRSLGEIALRSGDADAARASFERGLAIREARLGPDHVETADLRVDLARAREVGGEPDAAATLYAAALAAFEAALGPDDPRTARAEVGQARVTEDPAAARALALDAEARARRHARVMVSGLPERQALRFAATRTASLDLALSLPGLPADGDAIAATWDSLIRSRALVLDEILARRAAGGGGGDGGGQRAGRAEGPGRAETGPDPEVAAELAAAARAYAELLLVVPEEGSEDAHAQELLAARRHHEAAERRAIEGSGETARGRDPGLADVRAALPAGTALLAFARYDPGRCAPVAHEGDARYLAFVLTAGGEPVAVPLGEARELEPALRRWRAAVADPGADPAGPGREVRRRIWDPVAPHLEGAGLVFVVPDGEIHRVHLAVLPVDPPADAEPAATNGSAPPAPPTAPTEPATPAFLVETGPTLHGLTAERDLARPRPARRGRGLLALGGAAFSRPGSDAAPLFVPLPATSAETASIAALWTERGDGEALRLADDAASEEQFKALAPGRRVLHLATHAFFSGAGDGGGATRGIGGVGGAAAAGPARTLPPDVAGIALAGANEPRGPDRTEDGILTAGEIAALDLRTVEWAVLSACDTGVGSLQDLEGVLGLRRAFEAAGARTIVMSLWSVDDEATREWMETLYHARLAQRLGTADAVRHAARATLESRRSRGLPDHPFYWGGFVAAGDWN